jgi:hypothetical protein
LIVTAAGKQKEQGYQGQGDARLQRRSCGGCAACVVLHFAISFLTGTFDPFFCLLHLLLLHNGYQQFPHVENDASRGQAIYNRETIFQLASFVRHHERSYQAQAVQKASSGNPRIVGSAGASRSLLSPALRTGSADGARS